MNKKLNNYKANKVSLTNTVIDKMATPVLTPRPNKRPRSNTNVLWDSMIAGLHVRKSPTGNVSWFYFYETTINQHQRNYYIGKYPTMLTVKARQEAKRIAGLVASGHDPHIDKRSEIKQGTVAEWSEKYLKTLPMKKSRKKEIDIHRKYIQPTIGKLKITGVDPSDIEELKIKYEATPSQSNHAKIYTHKFFDWCVRNTRKTGVITNPATGIKLYAVEPRQFSMTDSVLVKVSEFLKTQLKSHPIEVFFVSLLTATGCRPNEIFSRPWTDIEWENAQMFNIPTKTGRKTIELSPIAMSIIKQLHFYTGDTLWLFPSPRNILNHRKNFRLFWDRLRLDTGLGSLVQLRDLRHHFATRMLKNTSDIATVSALLNHKNIQTTAKHYAQVLQSTKVKALKSNSKGTKLL